MGLFFIRPPTLECKWILDVYSVGSPSSEIRVGGCGGGTTWKFLVSTLLLHVSG